MKHLTQVQLWNDLQDLVKSGDIRECLERKTGIISYYLPEHEKKIDWTRFDKLK